MRRIGQCGSLLLVFCLGWFSTLALAQNVRPHAKGVLVPVYAGKESRPGALIRIGTVGTTYQKAGFFRLGLLPEVLVEDLTVEIVDSAALAPALEQARACCGRLAKAPLVIRNFRLRFRGEAAPRVEGRTLRFRPNGDWEIRDGRLDLNGAITPFDQAVLSTGSAEAGRVRLQTRSEPLSIL